MSTRYCISTDATVIAYDCCGSGPPVLLVHGGGGRRQEWHEAGYVDRLRGYFTVITIDLRGHGESDLPTTPAAYKTAKMGQDMLSVVDACGFDRFSLWGMSFGGKISRYLAVESDRIAKLVLMGTQLGPGVSGQLRQEAIDYCQHWPPIIQAQDAGALDKDALSPADREHLLHFNVPVILAWAKAMLNWPAIEPADFRCPTLWIAGSEDTHAMNSIREREESLKDSMVQVHIVDGLDHNQLFEDIDRVFPIMEAFTK